MKMTRLLSAAAGTAMLVGAFALPGTVVAHAATTDGPLTSLLSGNAITAPISAPINLCGVSVGALLGGANSNCVGGASSNVTEVGGLRGSGGGAGGPGGLSVGSVRSHSSASGPARSWWPGVAGPARSPNQAA